MRSSILLVMALAAVVLGIAGDARACSCMYLDTPSERFSYANAVFHGTVIEVDIPLTLRPGRDGELGRASSYLASWTGASVTAVFEVHESWKGVHNREFEVDLGDGLCCNCSLGAAIEAGEELLVFAYENDDGVMSVSGCNPPIRIEDAGPDLEFLGPGQQTLEPGRMGGGRRTFMYIVAVGFALAFALALVMVRRG
jgi:hypothetical protein